MVTAFPRVGTASSVRRLASQLTVTLGGLAFTVSGSASPVMGERVGARMAPLGLHGWRQRLSREGVA